MQKTFFKLTISFDHTSVGHNLTVLQRPKMCRLTQWFSRHIIYLLSQLVNPKVCCLYPVTISRHTIIHHFLP
jgi:hypothetical protein